MRIIIEDAQIDIVPKSWLSDKKIQNIYIQKGYLPIIDGSIHQHLLKNIPKAERLDRPDILHLGLLTVLGYSRIIKKLEIYFTCKSGTYEINSDTRIPRSQIRFYGILEQLLNNAYQGKLLKQVRYDDIIRTAPVVYFSSKGKSYDIKNLISNFENFAFGGFASGYFRRTIKQNDIVASLSPEPLELWTALSLFLAETYRS